MTRSLKFKTLVMIVSQNLDKPFQNLLKKKMIIKHLEKNEYLEISILKVNGQSFYADEFFNLKLIYAEKETISEIISSVLAVEKSDIFCEYSINCEDEQLKLQIVAEVSKRNQHLYILSKDLQAGGNFGFQINIRKCIKTKKWL